MLQGLEKAIFRGSLYPRCVGFDFLPKADSGVLFVAPKPFRFWHSDSGIYRRALKIRFSVLITATKRGAIGIYFPKSKLTTVYRNLIPTK